MGAFIVQALLLAPLLLSAPPPYTPFYYAGFEHASEANGLVVTFGSTYKTSLRLDGTVRYSGDSSVVAFVLGAHGPVNCNDTDAVCQRHRGYTIQRFRGHILGDTSRMMGLAMKCPCWIQFRWRYSNMPLHSHPTGDDDWDSQATLLDDTTDLGNQPVTVNRDSLGYVYLQHVPTFGLAQHLFQAGPSNDPTGAARMLANQWHLIQIYYDDDFTNGYAVVWVDGILESKAVVHNRNGTLAQFHAGLYCSPAVASGSVYNDDLLIAPVIDSNEAKFRYMATSR